MKKIKRGDEIVTIMKQIKSQLNELSISKDVDYKGCGKGYVTEKINFVINHLEWMKGHINE